MKNLLASLPYFQLYTAACACERLPMSYYRHSFLRTPLHVHGGSISNSPATSNYSSDGISPMTPFSVPQPSPLTLAELNIRKDSDEGQKSNPESQESQTSRSSSAIVRAHTRAHQSMGFDNLDSLDMELRAPFEDNTSLQTRTIVESPTGILLRHDYFSPPQHYQPEEPADYHMYATGDFTSSPNKRPHGMGDEGNELQPPRKRCRLQSIIAAASSAEDESEGGDEMGPRPQAPVPSNNKNRCPRCSHKFSKASALSRHRHCVSPRHLENQHDWNCLDFDAGPLTVYLCSQPDCTTFKFSGRLYVVEKHAKRAHNGLYTPVAGETQWQYSTKEELREVLEACLPSSTGGSTNQQFV